MKGFLATYIRELLILRKRFFKLIISLSINPLLYILAFGIALGKNININGRNYLEFLIPGLIAATSMLQAFNINVELNINRFYLKIFEEFQASPVSSFGYILGEIFGGITKAFLSIFIILIIAFASGVKPHLNFIFFFVIFLNAFIFSSLGIASAMFIKSHADQTLVTNFIITPMMFLGGTFFPVENLPHPLQLIIKILPLTIVSETLRSIALYQKYKLYNLFILLILSIISLLIAVYSVKNARD